MNHKRLLVAAAIIAFVVFGGFVLSVPHTRDVGKIASSAESIASVPAVSLHDSFKKGLHTITGSLIVANACTSVTARATLSGSASSTSAILIELSMPEDSGICLQTPTQVNFTTTLAAPAHLPITATVNGEAATTTVS